MLKDKSALYFPVEVTHLPVKLLLLAMLLEQGVKITELPSVSITKDWADWGVWVFSGLLVVVGFLQVLLLFRTLRAIQRQAGIMENNIKLIINKERMRISVEVLPLKLPLAKDGAEFEDCTIDYRVMFDGSTLAFITDSYAEGKVTDSPEPPYKKSAIGHILSDRTTIKPFAEPEDNGVRLYGLSKLQIEMIQNRKSFVHFYGSIKYMDFFEKERETSFCYSWVPRPLGLAIGPERWEKSGPPEANRET